MVVGKMKQIVIYIKPPGGWTRYHNVAIGWGGTTLGRGSIDGGGNGYNIKYNPISVALKNRKAR